MFSEILITAEEQHGSSAGARPARWSGATRRPNRHIHGTTHRVAWEMLIEERPHLGNLSGRTALAPCLWEDRKVGRDGSRHLVQWKWVGRVVPVGQRQGTVKIWTGDERIAVHPRAQDPGQRLILPGQREGLTREDNRPRREAMAVQVPAGEVERRSLEMYELAVV